MVWLIYMPTSIHGARVHGRFCLCLTWCVCHEVARRERLIDTAAKTRRRQMSSMDELRRQTSVDRLSTLAENSVEGSNPGEVAVEVRGDSSGTLKVSSAI